MHQHQYLIRFEANTASRNMRPISFLKYTTDSTKTTSTSLDSHIFSWSACLAGTHCREIRQTQTGFCDENR
uniref:Uncharacterized protein n=1 Tax=Trichogramma kaykai TaxID=54128 RepID=A0ABD2WKM5_9HYME